MGGSVAAGWHRRCRHRPVFA